MFGYLLNQPFVCGALKSVDNMLPKNTTIQKCAVMIAASFVAMMFCCPAMAQDAVVSPVAKETFGEQFKSDIQPLLNKFCMRCHNVDKMKSGIRVDILDGRLEDRQIFLWEDVLEQVADEAMPPEDEVQPTAEQRQVLLSWAQKTINAAKARQLEKNGAVRRLTISQYRNTLRNLLGIDDDLTDVLPPDSVSKDGFLNNSQTMELSPLLIESYFEVADRALDLCIVDENSKPTIQNFRMDLGAVINPTPFPNKLILGANNHLLKNSDFVVTELGPAKPFPYTPFKMQTKFRFIEGYQGNSTVRGWRDYDNIYHAVFACMRGNEGYPKGKAYETLPSGLALRPAIPSAELFQVESTYGPKANFKISLRELPEHGHFRVKVKAAKYDDGLLHDRGTPGVNTDGVAKGVSPTATKISSPQTIEVKESGVYRADLYFDSLEPVAESDASKLEQGLIGHFKLDGGAIGQAGEKQLIGELDGDAKFVDSPFGKALSVNGAGAIVAPHNDLINVGQKEFTVAAWIYPRELRQGGIVSRGQYNYSHGWVFDMPNNKGILRVETMRPDNQRNGAVQTAAGAIQVNRWQHVAAVVSRGENKTRLYINGLEVAVGSIGDANLDNPKVDLFIGRIPKAQLFKGEIDEVRLYSRALAATEIRALVEPGKRFVQKGRTEYSKQLSLELGDRRFSGVLHQEGFLTVRLAKGPLALAANYSGNLKPQRLVLTRLEESAALAQQFLKFEKRSPRLGVHVGLRRDCGSTLTRVEDARNVDGTEFSEFVFSGAIRNFPSPDVEKSNVNYLAGVREIGIRSEYTDGRDMPRLLVRSVEFEGPYYESWPPATHESIFIESKNKGESNTYAREVIRTFATRAFRRPVSPSEEELLLKVWSDSFAETNDFTSSIKDALVVVLTSPQFLFYIENSESSDPEPIDDYELATKLSLLFWNEGPDEQLLKLAESNSLRESINPQVDRLIEDKRFEQFIHEYSTQWFSLEKFDVVEIDRKRYPKLTRDRKNELRNEPAKFLQYLIQQDLPLSTLIQSDFIMANEVVASYYDLSDRSESGFEFVPVKHGSPSLGGILTQAGILSGLSNGRESNPVKRGAWLARKIIAEPPDDPPPNVPALPEDDNHQLSLREKLERHRNQEGCAKCHAGIDPWGVPLEQFDAGGLLKKTAVDARSTLPDGTDVKDVNELKTYLAQERIDQVAFSFMKHFATYAAGRRLTYNELEFLKTDGPKLLARDYRMKDMIRFVVNSDIFLEK